jgi:nucleoside-diphosphate-sugar epimerase
MLGSSNSGAIVIAGGSGFLGVSLATYLVSRGRSVVILSGHAPKPPGPWKHVSWDARSLGPWSQELNGAAGLINRWAAASTA